ncbi:hypothetical protein GSI_00232 [Ganoderma sinense ZZ0214-1]|uniref:DUF659 domain-containing protein n=1 Tax=Ganoderma sinense ZZ0214-1 TaxID=1077348 RepID=A0A2G8SS60_9APHY|nr:hypothetical protein GSI_00232 [Ganoderma sinense ZZ0214-1]
MLQHIKLNKAHTGAYLRVKLIKSLKSYGIEKKIMVVMCNNVANNKTMLKEMHILMPEFQDNEMHVCCFEYVLNLVKDPKWGLHLYWFIMLENERDVLKDLHHLLNLFLFTTNQISSNQHALIQDVILFINIFTEHVEKFKTHHVL